MRLIDYFKSIVPSNIWIYFRQKTRKKRILIRRLIRNLKMISLSNDGYKQHIIPIESDNKHVFFGYFDVTPFNYNDSKILALQVPLKEGRGHQPRKANVGYYQMWQSKHEFIKIGETSTWCWQQGCRLRWYPDPQNYQVAYNTFVNDGYGTVIYDLNTKKNIAQIKTPLYDIAIDGNWGVSLNFSRLQRLRPGYGYSSLPDLTIEEDVPDNDGLIFVDMKNGRTKQLFSIKEISKFEPNPTMSGATHYFNHASINSKGTRILFFHIWNKAGKRYTRLLTCDKDGLDLFPLVHDRTVSHFTWKSESEILCFTIKNQSETNYFLYKDKSDVKSVFCAKLNEDGHPSYSPSQKYLLTDTYPDNYGDRNLLLYNVYMDSLKCLGSFFSPFSMVGENRCDLHPRWSPNGKTIAFDSAHTGKRGIYVLPFFESK